MESSKLNNWIIKNDNWASLICAVLFAAVFVFAKWGTEVCFWTFLLHNLFPTLLVAIASFLATEGVIIVLIYGTKYRELLETRIEKIENKLNQAIEVMTIDAEDKSFESKLRLLRNKKDGVKWIVAKFIAKQLALKFNKLSFRITSHTYSSFSKQLYYEVDTSLFLTNSFNPYEWVRTLISDLDYEKIISTLVTQTQSTFENWWNTVIIHDKLEEKYTPEHTKAWKDIAKHNIDRKRLIILHKSELENFFVYEPFYMFFKKVNDISDIDTRFTTYDSLKATGNNIEADSYDYAIFDKEIALEWEIYFDDDKSDTFKKPKITLIDLNPLDSNDKAKSLKDFVKYIDDNWSRLDKIEHIEEKIRKSNQKYLDSIKNSNPHTISHSYCYHAYGGDCWKKINETSEYDLGRREQNFLRDFLFNKMQLENVRSCNVLHIGVGSGIEIEPIINGIRQEEREIQNYTIVDISPNILERTREKLTWLKRHNKVNNIQFHNICEDVTKSGWLYARPDNNPLIIILVANGFLFSQESLLRNISAFMKTGDYLLVTTEINNTASSNEYLNKLEESYKTDSVLKLFNISLNPLGINTFTNNTIDKQYYKFSFYNSTNDDDIYKKDIFEGYFDLALWRKNKGFTLKDFESIERIKIFQSYKPSDKNSIESYLTKFDLEVASNNSIDDAFNNPKYNEIGLVIQKKSN
jgi:uncharacterized SAM-dependent methyltransferase